MDNKSELKKIGLKATLPRLKILQLLDASDNKHLSAEMIYQQLQDQGEDVALATIYRVLTQFEAAGLVARHNFEEGHSIFEINDGGHHDHLVCVRCNQVQEFVDDEIEARQEAIAKKLDYEITDHSLTIYGICQICRKKHRPN